MATVAYPHIEIDTAGMPVFAVTQFKILHIILDRIAYPGMPMKSSASIPH